MRAIRFFVVLLFRVTLNLLAMLIRLLLPLVFAALRMLRALVSMSLTATINGPRQFTDRLAAEWTQNLLVMGVSRDHLDETYILCRFLARTMIVLGWVIATLISVAILRIVFGYFI